MSPQKQIAINNLKKVIDLFPDEHVYLRWSDAEETTGYPRYTLKLWLKKEGFLTAVRVNRNTLKTNVCAEHLIHAEFLRRAIEQHA